MSGEAIAIEHRLPKGVDVERERSRHAICARRVEQIVRLLSQTPRDAAQYGLIIQAGRPAAGRLDGSYLAVLDKMANAVEDNPSWQSYRIGASIFPPGDQNTPFSIAHHILGFEHLARSLKLDQHPQVVQRLNFLRWANQNQCGVVELIDIYQEDLQHDSTPVASQSQTPIMLQELVEKKSAGDSWFSSDFEQSLNHQQQRSQREAMTSEVERALKSNGAININNYSHMAITDGLHDFVFTKAPKSPQLLKVVYEDGSQGRPFPIYCLPQPELEFIQRFSTVRPLKVAMLSIRHMEMDREVDMAWFRNTEASLRRSCFADTDYFCYQETLRQLKMLAPQIPVFIHLYQTGLEPAVVGFYRALVEFLLSKDPNKPQLAVVPRYFRGLGVEYRSGEMWA